MKISFKLIPIACSMVLSLAGASYLAAESKGTIDQVSGKPCAQCHRSKITGAFVHEAVAGLECTPCHNATGGNHQKNRALYGVKDKSPKLCNECHDSKEKEKSVHPAIEAEGCISCHAPHNSPLNRLLRTEAPALCFKCHDRGLLNEKETTKATGFRDGANSMHYIHAGGSNNFSCFTCHDAHASSQPHMIRPKGTNGKDAVTITYTATDKGGNCTTSCHDALGYERK